MNSIKIAASQGMLQLPTEHGFALSSLRYGGRGPTEPRVKTLSEYSFPIRRQAGPPACPAGSFLETFFGASMSIFGSGGRPADKY